MPIPNNLLDGFINSARNRLGAEKRAVDPRRTMAYPRGGFGNSGMRSFGMESNNSINNGQQSLQSSYVKDNIMGSLRGNPNMVDAGRQSFAQDAGRAIPNTYHEDPREELLRQWQAYYAMKARDQAVGREVARMVADNRMLQRRFSPENAVTLTVPDWAMNYIVNGDPTGLSPQEIASVDQLVKRYGDQYDMPEGEPGFTRYNDLPGEPGHLGSNVYDVNFYPPVGRR